MRLLSSSWEHRIVTISLASIPGQYGIPPKAYCCTGRFREEKDRLICFIICFSDFVYLMDNSIRSEKNSYGSSNFTFLRNLHTVLHSGCTSLHSHLPYDPAIPLLGIYPEKNTVWKDTCIPMFIAALFTITKTWKQPKCPSTEEWIEKMWYICTMEYYTAIKKNSHKKAIKKNEKKKAIKKNEMTICSNMDGPRDCHTEWSKSDRERQISYDIAYMRNLKKWFTLLYLKWITNKDLLYSTGNSAQYSVIT